MHAQVWDATAARLERAQSRHRELRTAESQRRVEMLNHDDELLKSAEVARRVRMVHTPMVRMTPAVLQKKKWVVLLILWRAATLMYDRVVVSRDGAGAFAKVAMGVNRRHAAQVIQRQARRYREQAEMLPKAMAMLRRNIGIYYYKWRIHRKVPCRCPPSPVVA